ncbi:MAG: hypothetical protein H0V00_06185 [Chloroflexia bacterium]|nr:hypothetical protein [Chloroflexia bacterium]
MFGSDIALKHQVSEMRFRDFLAEAERQRAVDIAIAANPPPPRPGISEARTAVATALLRAGSRLMPEEAPDGRGNPANRAFELRPGQ